MNAVRHQLKWDFRRIRALWIFWLVVLAGGTFWSLQAATAPSAARGIGQTAGFAKSLVVYLLGLLLVARLMSTTPFTGAAAFWKTRPLTRRALFWTKTLLIVFLIEAPVFLAQWITWSTLNFGGQFLIWASLHFIAVTLSVFLLAAIWASLCERFASFWIGLASTGGFLAVCGLIYRQLAARLPLLPLEADSTLAHAPATTASTLLTMFLILLATALVAWWLAARADRRPAALATLALGLALAAGANNLWRTDFLKRIPSPLPDLALQTIVLDQAEPVPEGYQLLWNQVAVELPPGRFAEPASWNATLSRDDEVLASTSRDPDWSAGSGSDRQQLRIHYPAATRLIVTSPANLQSVLERASGALGDGFELGLAGSAPLTVYEWQPVASLPLREGASAEHPEGGLIRIDSVTGNSLKLTHLAPPLMFGSQFHELDLSYRHPHNYLACVVHQPEAGTAVVMDNRGFSGSGGGSFSISRRSYDLGNRRLLPLARAGESPDSRESLRLDVFAMTPVAKSVLRFERDNWTPYHDRPLDTLPHPTEPRPAIAKAPLPADPSPDEVDAYLDGILFSISDSLTRDTWNRLEAELMALGPAHLDRLIARLPVGNYAENLVARVIGRLATEAHKPALLEALPRDLALASLFIQRGWQSDAAPVLAEVLRLRRPLDYESAPAAVRIVASAQDPATYDDLYWHFVHSRGGQRDMAEALAGCPDFPLDHAIAELWSMIRFEPGGRRQQVAALAARVGDKEALRVALLESLDDRDQDDLALLAEAVAHPGGPAVAEWVHQNFDALTYNSATRTFGLD